tara:strand:+ start:2029 stop:3450 length:1422 start_codon:yes stop_codon:yes gene_type:complete
MANYDKEVSNLAKEATTNAELQNELMRWMKANQDRYLPELLDNSFNFMADTRDAPIITAMTDRSSMPNGLPTRTRFGGKRPEYVKHTEPPAKVEVEEDNRVQVATGIRPLDKDTKPIVDVIPPIDLSRLATRLPWQGISDVAGEVGDIVGNGLGWADDKTGNVVSDSVDYLRDKLGWQSPWDYTKDWEELLYGDRNVATDAVDNRIFYDNEGNEIAKNDQDYLPDDRQQSETRMPWEQMPETLDWMSDQIYDQYGGRLAFGDVYDPHRGFAGTENSFAAPPNGGSGVDSLNYPDSRDFTPPWAGPGLGGNGEIPDGAGVGLTGDEIENIQRRASLMNGVSDLTGMPTIIEEPTHIKGDRLDREQMEIEQGTAVPVGQDDIRFLMDMYPDGVDESGNFVEFINDASGNPAYLRDPTGQLRRWIDSLSGKQSGVVIDAGGAVDRSTTITPEEGIASMDWQDELLFPDDYGSNRGY